MEQTVHFTLRPLYLWRRVPGAHWIGSRLELRAGLDALKKAVYCATSRIRSTISRLPSQVSYSLSYRDFLYNKWRNECKKFIVVRVIWEDKTKMYIKETESEVVDWINLAQPGDEWQVLVNTVMDLLIPWNAGNV